MTTKSGIFPLWNASDIVGDLNEHEENVIDKTVRIFQFSGEHFVNTARNLRTYKDVTGNLRSSVGYLILANNEVMDASFGEGVPKFNGEGKAKGEAEAIKKVRNDKGVVMVGIAGMEYGRDVEAKGKDVITGPAEEAKELISDIIKEL